MGELGHRGPQLQFLLRCVAALGLSFPTHTRRLLSQNPRKSKQEMNAGLFILGWPSQPGAARVGNMGMGSVECRPGQGGTLGPWHGAPDPNCPAGLQIPQAQLPKFSNVFQSRLTLQSSHPGCGAGPGTGVIPLGTKTFFSSHERLALPPPLPTVGRRRQRSPWGEKPYHLKWVCRFILAKPGGQARMGVNTDPDK